MARRAIPWLTVDTARQEIAKLSDAIKSQSDFRVRQKLARQLAFAGTSLAKTKTELDLVTIEVGLIALKLARESGAVTDDLNRAAALLSKLRLDALGCTDAVVIAEAKKTIAVDGGCLAGCGSPTIAPDAWTGSNVEILNATNAGDFFLVGLGADGRYLVAVRLVDAPEPVLKPNEYKQLDYATEIGCLRISSSELRFGAPEDMALAAKIVVPNGLLKIQCFRLRSGNNEKILLVACQTAVLPPPLNRVPEFR
jgi:hypothetical protein